MQTQTLTTETQRITQTLQDTFNGDAWHGPSVQQVLTDVTAEEALQRPAPHGHTIWELVLHITSWRTFTWNKIAGDPSFDIKEDIKDWPPVTDTSPLAWQAALQALAGSQQQLISALDSFSDERLREIVPGRSYDFYKLLHGIIQHDLYHAGQIALLKKMVKGQ